MPKPLEQTYLKSILDYEPDTGALIWKVSRNSYGGGVDPGDIAGHPAPSGYILVGIDGGLYRAHRLAWQLFYGVAPEGLLDHRDGDRSNNRIVNLRPSCVAKNAQNLRVSHKDSSTGFLGVERYGATRFMARICLNGIRHKIGVFDTPELAHVAYVDAKRKLHEHGTL